MRRSIATVSLSGTLNEKLTAVANAGFDGVEMFDQDLLCSLWTPRRIRERCEELGLKIEMVQPFRDLEGRIDDCAIMASIALQMVEPANRGPGRQARKGNVRGVRGREDAEEAEGGLSGHVARREAARPMKRRRRSVRKRNRQRLAAHARRLRR